MHLTTAIGWKRPLFIWIWQQLWQITHFRSMEYVSDCIWLKFCVQNEYCTRTFDWFSGLHWGKSRLFQIITTSLHSDLFVLDCAVAVFSLSWYFLSSFRTIQQRFSKFGRFSLWGKDSGKALLICLDFLVKMKENKTWGLRFDTVFFSANLSSSKTIF